ncbi:ComEC/Rec2 family competence protein [Caenibius sp. WL]|uniref:ComEC/Rec2 family competence protein n=1 Tax=Caenibius sp. WL TaxID=2872646 RepID=UPI001C9A225A|nr:ComEC/Rec2 family competence protein [Caenibius sp. WL]QZP07007.1 ComEC/Rec2 family competence protein [Caenibius sp. WL]
MTGQVPFVPLAGDDAGNNVAVQRPWRKSIRLSSIGGALESFLASAGLDRGPWLAVGFAAGIALWFVLPGPQEWVIAILLCAVAALAAGWAWKGNERRIHCTMAVVALAVVLASGIGVIWVRSALVGAEPVARPFTATLDARVLTREERPAEERVRLVLATREPESGRAIQVRVNLPDRADDPAIAEGAVIRLKARLMPPAPPMLPGAYDFARAAWFKGYAATGNAVGPVTVLEAGEESVGLPRLQRGLARHIRARIDGSPGTIAAALASGDRGAIAESDEQAMRDSGLTHLLSISGLHVSAVIGAAYVLALWVLAGWPWLALRVRLPLVAAGVGAIAGIGYTLLTGAEVPTVRSCAGAVLVLLALALGREPLSLRMVAVAVMFVLLLWPESLIGPSFQMSFAAVIAIIALHTAAPIRAFLAPREEGWIAWMARRTVMLLVTGFVIELALMPIVLFHFHRAGVYGALANMVGIPLTTFITMPLIALALLCDLAGIGAPVWWMVGKSLELLLSIAHVTASQPGAVTHLPTMGHGVFALFLAGGLWLALWRGRVRLLGLLPVILAAGLALRAPGTDILVTGDGRHVAIVGEGERLVLLRASRSDYTRDNLAELSGLTAEPVLFGAWPGARCSRDFCTATVVRAGKAYHLLATRSRALVEAGALTQACARADIVIADRRLPRNCTPRWIKADRRMLQQSGGLAINLTHRSVTAVAQNQGRHGWWKGHGRGKVVLTLFE